MSNTTYTIKQSPSDLQVIEFQYQHVSQRGAWTGKLVVLPAEYRWLLALDDNPQAYGEVSEALDQRGVWKDFNDSAAVIEYVDTILGETVEDALVSMLSPDDDGFHLVVTDSLIRQLTHEQLHTLLVGVDKAALSQTLQDVVSLRKLEVMAAKAMEEYHAGLTEPLDPDTL